MKKRFLEISSFHSSVPKIKTRRCMVPEMWCATINKSIILLKCTKNHDHILHFSWNKTHDKCSIYFSFWAIFFPFTPVMTQKVKIKKDEKNAWRYHHFTHVYQKLWSHQVQFVRYGAQCRLGEEWWAIARTSTRV